MAEIIDDTQSTPQYESVSSGFQEPTTNNSDPLFDALVKNNEGASADTSSSDAPQSESVSSGFQEAAPQTSDQDPLFEALAKEGEAPESVPSASMASRDIDSSVEDKKRRALELLKREGLIGFDG